MRLKLKPLWTSETRIWKWYGYSSDDVHISSLNQFEGKSIVITEKMDGENTTLYSDYIHARSIDSRHHNSRNWVKALQAQLAYQIPSGWRICGENLYAQHSVTYTQLASYFLGFSIWDENNRCLSWSDTIAFFERLDIKYPKVIYQGIWQEKHIRQLQVDTSKQEGYVVRLQDSFAYTDFALSVAKWVRQNHVQSDEHWMHKEVIANGLSANDIKDGQEK